MKLFTRFSFFLLSCFVMLFFSSSCETNRVDEDELAREREDEIIREYLVENNIEAERTASGLYYRVIEPSSSTRKPQLGQEVIVHYEGRLIDGKVFDSSFLRDDPFTFVLGAGQVIPGWDIGVQLISLGETAELFIPSHLGYGSRGSGSIIPPNTILIFKIEVLGF